MTVDCLLDIIAYIIEEVDINSSNTIEYLHYLTDISTANVRICQLILKQIVLMLVVPFCERVLERSA